VNSEGTGKTVSGFSKLSKIGKLKWIVNNFFKDPEAVTKEMKSYWFQDEQDQKIIDSLSENTISNFVLPFSVAPNFIINGREYAIPMVIEESSVVAAASHAAKYWSQRGGIHARVVSTIKEGSVYFFWDGDISLLMTGLPELDKLIREDCRELTAKMESRGGGIVDIGFVDMGHKEPGYKKLNIRFETCDSMGANFINTILEEASSVMKGWFEAKGYDSPDERRLEVIMSILSNYTPQCLVEASVECPVEELTNIPEMTPQAFARRFYKAVRIATVDPSRAVTHNKGIFNGIDAVVLATGNDFRAVEACGHAFAARSGHYQSLSTCTINDGIFSFTLLIPIALGTVGGLTRLHPIARRSLELLGNPGAEELMQIVAATGLAQNFAAVRSLVTTGIQKGHMKMHLQNILWQMKATPQEQELLIEYFEDKIISYSSVRAQLEKIRSTL
jgi:hydroxymethylglutaryl-CoA reductase